jgi:hypothetical protein
VRVCCVCSAHGTRYELAQRVYLSGAQIKAVRNRHNTGQEGFHGLCTWSLQGEGKAGSMRHDTRGPGSTSGKEAKMTDEGEAISEGGCACKEAPQGVPLELTPQLS